MALITSTNATVAFLSASGRAAKIGSSAAGPTSFSFAMAFCVAGLWGFEEDLISVTSRSARKLVKKPIQPFRDDELAPDSRGRNYATAPDAARGSRLYNPAPCGFSPTHPIPECPTTLLFPR